MGINKIIGLFFLLAGLMTAVKSYGNRCPLRGTDEKECTEKTQYTGHKTEDTNKDKRDKNQVWVEEEETPVHALYLSTCDVVMKTSKSSLVTIKVFSDDLQSALRNYSSGYQKDDLAHFFQKNTSLANRYFGEHLRLRINNKDAQLNYKSFTIENDVHFIQFEFQHSGEWKGIELRADYFMEIFPAQVNIFKFEKGNEKKFLKMEKGSGVLEIFF